MIVCKYFAVVLMVLTRVDVRTSETEIQEDVC